MKRRLPSCAIAGALLLSACADIPPKPRPPSPGHIGTQRVPPAAIPKPVMRTPYLPPPAAAPPSETYTVVVNEVPVKELLFALARDARVNIDVSPGIEGVVTLNAIDQSLNQILDRVARQVDLRYEVKAGTLVISPDAPFLRTYKVDYVNLSRNTESTVSVATQVATTGTADVGAGGGGGGGGGGGSSGGDNNSTTVVKTTSDNSFWETLTKAVGAILEDGTASRGGGTASAAGSTNVIPNPESGLLVVRATARQHEKVREYLDQVLTNARRQVLIEATIVEVELSDRYRAGIDFSKLFGGSIVSQSLLGTNLLTAPFFLLEFANAKPGDPKRDISLTVRLLKQFGDTRVLSSPKIMAMNNQTAIFKVVENRVFFTATSDTVQAQTSVVTTFETTPHTVPVGLVMSVTPQIDGADEVTLTVRPTITRTVGTGVQDPNPNLRIESRIPEIQVREMESVLKLQSGQIAILGGLMQDENRRNTDGLPVLSEDRTVGEAFKFRDNNFVKTELIVFLRPTVIRSPSVEGDLRAFKRMLPENLQPAEPQHTGPMRAAP